ncbi:MAG: thioredoxin domain-containing protein [Anaerolineae bacterium]|nr:thioredoxin domain-containing protein [Anaerolineae bacterium]
MMNRLQHETSPYLLQHADNPVDWYPWGEEAFEKAKSEDKPILLSVGYSACHWCHVMAHESFEHQPTAEIMNELFINIKVDREERPDVDDIYMQAVQAMSNGQGGWPMTVFMLPDGRPFYGGTYYPREPRMGMPAFRQILEAVHDAYVKRRAELEEQAGNLSKALDRSHLRIDTDDSALKSELLDSARKGLKQGFDANYGGFGSAPKFPNPMNLEYLLRDYARTGDADTLHVVTYTLEKMARGGIYDQIGGGFHRYSVDAIWLVPHFEKMLYDNAQLSRLYLHAYQVTGNDFFKTIAVDIYDYILREMTAPEGGFYSTTDADSEGEEGKFFVWTLDEIKESLANISDDVPDAYEVAVEYWGMTRGGNFEGSNILNVPNDTDVVAERLNITVEELHEKLAKIKDRLYATRTSRVAPALDDKILTAWNGMMLASLAEAARVLKRDDYLAAAERAGDFLLENLVTDKGRLYRTYKAGKAKINAYLEDYANLIDALLELYQSTFVEKWFNAARQLADVVLEHFAAEDGGFFDTSDDHEKLIVRPRALNDNATPSGNSMMAKQLIRLAAYTGDTRYDEAARAVIRPMIPAMQQYPQAFGEALNAADMLIQGLAEVAIVGNPVTEETKALLNVVREKFSPNIIVALSREAVTGEANIPLLNYRTMRGEKPTVYVCRNFACKMPVTTADEMKDLLKEA